MAGRDRAHALFAQTMGYVAATAALFALGAWLGRDLVGPGTQREQSWLASPSWVVSTL